MDQERPEGGDLPPAAATGSRVLVLAAGTDRGAERARQLTRAGLQARWTFASSRADLTRNGSLDCELVLADVSLRAKSLIAFVRHTRPGLPVVVLRHRSPRGGRPSRPDTGIIYCDDDGLLAGVLERALGQDGAETAAVRPTRRDEILDLIAEGVVQDDPEGRLTFVNRAAAEMLGYRPEELVGKPRQVLVPPDQSARVNASDGRRRRSQSDRYELELQHRDGKRIPVLVTGSPRFVDGRPAGTTAVFTEISTLKRTQESLRQTAETLQAMIQASPIAVTTLDLEGRVTLWNAAAEKVFGWTAEEALGKPLPFVPPESQDEHRALRQRVLQGEWLDGIEVDRRRKDGSLVVIRLSTAPMHGPGGEVIGILGMMADVTEEKKAASAMAESEVKFRTLAEESPNMIFINRRGRVLYANKRAAEVMGYERHEFGAPDFDFTRLLAPESRDEALRNFHRHQAGYEVPPALYTLIARDGRRVEGIHNTRIIDYGGEAAILGIVTDVTEQRRDEEALRKSEAMLSESQRVAAVGHYDLDVAKGTWTSSEMLDEIFGIDAEHPKTVDSWLGIVHADHRAELHAYLRDSVLKEKNAFDREYPIVRVSDGSTRWVHGLGRLQFDAAGEPARIVRLNLEPHPLDGLLGDVLVAQRARAEVKGLEVIHEPKPGSPAARVSREQMTQVLTNLVGNAIAYTPAGGRIVVETVRSADRKTEVGARVWNNGPPIPGEDVPHLFERFYRGHTGRGSGEAGTGLGLAICKEIVDRHGGWIEVESSPETGTSFTVWVPAAGP